VTASISPPPTFESIIYVASFKMCGQFGQDSRGLIQHGTFDTVGTMMMLHRHPRERPAIDVDTCLVLVPRNGESKIVQNSSRVSHKKLSRVHGILLHLEACGVKMIADRYAICHA
jgi:hypothetical protein